MLRKIVIVSLCLLLTGLALAQAKPETKQVTGAVKSITADSLVVTADGADAKDWTFIIDKDTNVVAKGASHTSRKAEDSSKTTMVTDFVKMEQKVAVDYLDKGGKLTAVEIRVK